MRDPEYDRFGPWIIEISEEDPPPPLFLPYVTRSENPLLSFKIPRKISRRDAHPGMNLYDYMVTLFRDDLIILERTGNHVKVETFLYRDIQYLRIGEHLLKGYLHLAMTEKYYSLPFNTVSEDVIWQMVTLIRERYVEEPDHAILVEAPDTLDDNLSFYFSRLLAREKRRYPQRQVMASQSETPVGSYETGAFRRLLFGIVNKRLMESLHLSDGRELKIIDRGKTFRYRGQAHYGTDTCYIPTSKITGLGWQADPKNAAVLNLILQTPGGVLSFAFVRDNPSFRSYSRFLSTVSGSPEAPMPVSNRQACWPKRPGRHRESVTPGAGRAGNEN